MVTGVRHNSGTVTAPSQFPRLPVGAGGDDGPPELDERRGKVDAELRERGAGTAQHAQGLALAALLVEERG